MSSVPPILGSGPTWRSALPILALSVACGRGASTPAAPAPEGTPSIPEAVPATATEEQVGAAPSPVVEQAAHEHAPGHEHGTAGYAMDFSASERFAAHFDDPGRDAWQKVDEVVQLLDVQAGHAVADLGAGTGYFLEALSKGVGGRGQVLALDAEPNMIKHMEQRARSRGWDNVVVRHVSHDDPGLAEDSVDRILVVNTWHHIADRGRYAAKLAKALRARGAVLIVDFTLDSDIGPPSHHRLAPERVIEELESGGLEARLVRESLPKQYAVRGTRR